LAFAPTRAGKPPVLVSVARERIGTTPRFDTSAHVWDVEAGESVASLSRLPDVLNVRPGATVWHTGKRRDQVGVALALVDGKLRVWEVAEGEKAVREAQDLPDNVTVARLSDRNRLLTAVYGRGKARLRLWRIADGTLQTTALERVEKADSIP